MERDNFKTIQPYFVINSAKFYQHIYASCGISHFYSFTPVGDGDICRVPDGCCDIIFEYGDNKVESHVCGSVLSAGNLTFENNKQYFGVRFLNGHVPEFLDLKGSELVGNKIDLSLAIKNKNQFEQIHDCRDFKLQMELFLTEYLKIHHKHTADTYKNNIVSFCRDLIYSTKGGVSVAELEMQTGYSTRYISKLFDEAIGLSPKKFANIVRYQSWLDYLNNNRERKISDGLAYFNYYDQAQMNKEFKNFSGVTPKEYLQLTTPESYNEKIVSVPIFTKDSGNIML